MAGLSGARNTPRMGEHAVLDILACLVEASTHCYQGGMVGLDAAGYLVPAGSNAGTATAPVSIIGRLNIDADNSGTGFSVYAGNGLQGFGPVPVQRGVFAWDNSTGVDAISNANIGQIAYAVDDHTVALTAGTASGAATAGRLAVGKIVPGPAGNAVDSSGVWVETGLQTAGAAAATTIAMPSSGALAAGTIVSLNSSGQLVASTAGQVPLGVLVNATTAANQAGVVVVLGGHPAVKAGGTIAIGGFFESNASGQAVAISATSVSGAAVTAGQIVGQALTAGVAAGTFAALILPRGIPATTAA